MSVLLGVGVVVLIAALVPALIRRSRPRPAPRPVPPTNYELALDFALGEADWEKEKTARARAARAAAGRAPQPAPVWVPPARPDGWVDRGPAFVHAPAEPEAAANAETCVSAVAPDTRTKQEQVHDAITLTTADGFTTTPSQVAAHCPDVSDKTIRNALKALLDAGQLTQPAGSGTPYGRTRKYVTGR